jgi:tetratricopeptide (TPR) repeat protein
MYSDTYQRYRKLISNGRFDSAARLAGEAYFAGDARNSFWLTRQAAALTRARKYSDARAAAAQALAIDPVNPYALLAMADALKGLGQYEDAITHYREVAAASKLTAIGQNGWLDCLAALSRWERVLEMLIRWKMPAAQRLRWQAKAEAALDRDNDALKTVQAWLRTEPDKPEALWLLVDLEIRQNGIEAVVKRYGRLARIASRPPVYKEIYASLCRRAGRPDQALKAYEKLDQGTATTAIHRKQAFALAKSGRETDAIPMMEELLTDHPRDFYLHSGYQGACRRSGQTDRAMAFYEILIQRHPQEKSLYGWMKKINKR